MSRERGETYLGDGLYMRFDTDSRQIRLRAPRTSGDHEVYLNGATFEALVRLAKTWGWDAGRVK
jgi:hypothetical protein